MDKETLLTPRLPEATVEIPGVGTIRVRGLNRAEAMLVQQAQGPEAIERKLLAFGMVDPVMTEAEVGRWQKASVAAELEPVTAKITELSGLLPGSAKEAVKTFRGESRNGVRLLPGSEAGDDGSETADGTE
jgi:hypothetical protein